MSQLQLIFEKQWLHLLLLTGLITGLVLLGTLNSFQAGNLWDVGTMIWFRLAVAIAIAHQVLVWFCWRTQLHLFLLTRLLGDNGFTVYKESSASQATACTPSGFFCCGFQDCGMRQFQHCVWLCLTICISGFTIILRNCRI